MTDDQHRRAGHRSRCQQCRTRRQPLSVEHDGVVDRRRSESGERAWRNLRVVDGRLWYRSPSQWRVQTGLRLDPDALVVVGRDHVEVGRLPWTRGLTEPRDDPAVELLPAGPRGPPPAGPTPPAGRRLAVRRPAGTTRRVTQTAGSWARRDGWSTRTSGDRRRPGRRLARRRGRPGPRCGAAPHAGPVGGSPEHRDLSHRPGPATRPGAPARRLPQPCFVRRRCRRHARRGRLRRLGRWSASGLATGSDIDAVLANPSGWNQAAGNSWLENT
jgi:hypothetical protein